MKPELLQKLRNKKPVRLFKNYMGKKAFFHIQLNKKAETICWQRFVSADKQNWIELNSYLSLHDVANIIENK